jgi:AraC-like DNA-binding protein
MKPQVRIAYRQADIPQFRFHSHTFYEVYYFHEGQCNYLIGDNIYVLKPGDLIILNGMTLHRPHIKGSVYVRSTVHFDPHFARELLKFSAPYMNLLQPFHDLRNHRVHLTGESREQIEALLEKMHRSQCGGAPGDIVQLYVTFMELMLHTYRAFEGEMKRPHAFPSVKEEHTERIIRYIEEHLSEDIHLRHLEQALHLNRYYLEKTFKEVTGTTIFRYIYERRINEAKMLILLHPELSLTEISYRAGFKHLSHFSRIFKKIVGMTAEQYRGQSQSNTPI